LSRRDELAFVDLWSRLDVQSRISYGTLSNLAEKMINSSGSVRDLTRRFICGTESKTTQDEDATPNGSILLFDEVDVFFSDDFMGRTYNPVFSLDQEYLKDLQEYIWQKRGNITFSEIQQRPEYKAAATAFPDFTRILDQAYQHMIYDATNFRRTPTEYKCIDGKIGYAEHGSISYNTVYRYKTAFAHLHERDQKNVSSETARSKLGVQIDCGSYSYAEFPKSFDAILGVTGTLDTIQPAEKKILQDLYEIRKTTITPSVYGESQLTFEEHNSQHVHVALTRDAWHQKIVAEILHAVDDQKRAVLVFFQSESVLNQFVACGFGQELKKHQPAPVTIYEGLAPNRFDKAVSDATLQGAISLLPRTFGRGIDFVCYDSRVEAKGGVHVIQTFFSESVSEEIQIKGRTARQSKQGSYQMVLCADDLSLDINELKRVSKNGADQWAALVAARTAEYLRNIERRKMWIQNASANDAKAQSFREQLVNKKHNRVPRQKRRLELIRALHDFAGL
jgi:hypothetical protein